MHYIQDNLMDALIQCIWKWTNIYVGTFDWLHRSTIWPGVSLDSVWRLGRNWVRPCLRHIESRTNESIRWLINLHLVRTQSGPGLVSVTRLDWKVDPRYYYWIPYLSEIRQQVYSFYHIAESMVILTPLLDHPKERKI